MEEDGDSDIDMSALEELMAGAEKEVEKESSNNTSQPTTFSSLLETLDEIPVKIPQGKSFKTSVKGKIMSKDETSVVHSGDTDSEDDEDKKYFHNRQYNDYGASIKKMLQSNENSQESKLGGFSGRNSTSWKNSPKTPVGTLCVPSSDIKQIAMDLNVDKLTGVRISNPLVSSVVLADRLQGRKVVPFSDIKNFTSFGKIKDDWVVVGVIVTKSPPRTSAKGSTYSVLRLSDLRGIGDLKTVSLFLFSSACKTHSKNSVGTVIGILNPSIFDNSKSHGDEASLSVDSADRVMVLGTSRDFAFCKSKKKNGENCTSFVNKASCDFCIYHVKQEYQNCSRRSELQASFSGKGLTGGLNGLRNKVLGKSEVFYAGQSFTAIPAKKSNKLSKQDNLRLSVLSGESSAPVKRVSGKKRLATSVELCHRQASKDIERLRKLDSLAVATNAGDQRSITNASLQNFAEKLKVENTKQETLAFISKAKEQAALRPVSKTETVQNQTPLSSEIVKTPTQLSRGASFALAATQKSSNSSPMNNASAFGLGRKTKTSDGASPSRNTDPKSTGSPSSSKISGKERIATPKALDRDASLIKSPGESKLTFTPKIIDEDVKSFGESKIISNFESRISKSLTAKVEVEKDAPTITKASELGLGRGRVGAQTRRPTSKIIPTISTSIPVLGAGMSSKGLIEFDLSSSPRSSQSASPRSSQSASPRSSQSARLKAAKYIRAKGGITKEDPNKLELSSKKKSEGTKRPQASKRKIEDALVVSDIGRKKMKNLEEEKQKEKMAEFRALMEVSSKHVDLVVKADNEAQEEYFDKLERKEQMEEKMLNTYKVVCKAVTCKQCKYTAFSAADICKEERHSFKVHDAVKRFFKCADCGNRTCCLEIIPLKTCSNCNSSRWERAAMIREKKIGIGSETLSIRGGEEKFIGSVVTGANLNLLVPD